MLWFDPKAMFEDQPIARQLLAYSIIFVNGPENGKNGQVNRILRMFKALNAAPGAVLGCESFIPRRLDMSHEFLSPVRIRAGLESRLSVADPPIQLYTQTPNDAITTFNNSRLQALRLYRPGPDHVNDAMRHCLLWIRKLKALGIEGFQERHGHEEGWFE